MGLQKKFNLATTLLMDFNGPPPRSKSDVKVLGSENMLVCANNRICTSGQFRR